MDGGAMMLPLLVCSIVGLAVGLERWKVFRVAGRDTSVLRRMILQLLRAGKPDDAIRLCEETKGPVAAVLLVGLNRYRRLVGGGRGKAEVEASVGRAMSEYAPHVVTSLEKRVGVLLTVGSAAPLLGMTGTVTGMIRAFTAMSQAGALQGTVVASGIAEALITTAAGLLIAVPAVVLYNMLVNRLEQFTLTIETAANELVDFIHLQDQPSA